MQGRDTRGPFKTALLLDTLEIAFSGLSSACKSPQKRKVEDDKDHLSLSLSFALPSPPLLSLSLSPYSGVEQQGPGEGEEPSKIRCNGNLKGAVDYCVSLQQVRV